MENKDFEITVTPNDPKFEVLEKMQADGYFLTVFSDDSTCSTYVQGSLSLSDLAQSISEFLRDTRDSAMRLAFLKLLAALLLSKDDGEEES